MTSGPGQAGERAPSVSVFVPCYKYGHFLRECVESILTQADVEVGVLVLDDASPDETPEVAGRLVAEDSRVEYVRHTTNRGHIATYNEGIEWASGDYTILLSADDLLTEGSLARATGVLGAHPNAAFAYGNAPVWTSGAPAPTLSTTSSTCAYEIVPGHDWVEARCRSGGNPARSPEVIVRTDMQKFVGGYRPELPHAGDLEMWMRLAAHGDVAVLEADQAYYRFHGSNMHPAAMNSTEDVEQLRLVFDNVLTEKASLFDDADHLRTLATRSIARREMWFANQVLESTGSRRASLPLARDAIGTSAHGAMLDRKFYGYITRLIVGPTAYASARSAAERFVTARRSASDSSDSSDKPSHQPDAPTA